jgi:hypothetical protein
MKIGLLAKILKQQRQWHLVHTYLNMYTIIIECISIYVVGTYVQHIFDIYICMYVYMYKCRYVKHVCILYIYVYMYVNMYLSIYVSIYICCMYTM